jgi:hypothetical protein
VAAGPKGEKRAAVVAEGHVRREIERRRARAFSFLNQPRGGPR